MKKKAFLMLLGIVVGFSAFAQGIDLKLNKVSVQEAITEVNRSANYSIVVNSNDVDLTRKVDVNAKDATIETVLNQIFAGQKVSYVINGRKIAVTSDKGQTQSARAAYEPVVVKGQILDKQGLPIIGATVSEKGAARLNGAATDLDGNFVITVAKGAQLEVACVGYMTQVIKAGDGSEKLLIVLPDDVELLDEAVVMGYGSQRKKLITGSTIKVGGDKLVSTNAVDAFGALQSQAAGVNITSNSGQPGESYKVTIRGMGTISDTEPLYVIRSSGRFHHGAFPERHRVHRRA